jgi:hypothetical protein
MKIAAASLIFCTVVGHGFSFSVTEPNLKPLATALLAKTSSETVAVETLFQSRRQVLCNSLLLASTALFTGSVAANADVSDGNALPEGAAQFSRVIKAKPDLIVSLQIIKTRAVDVLLCVCSHSY